MNDQHFSGDSGAEVDKPCRNPAKNRKLPDIRLAERAVLDRSEEIESERGDHMASRVMTFYRLFCEKEFPVLSFVTCGGLLIMSVLVSELHLGFDERQEMALFEAKMALPASAADIHFIDCLTGVNYVRVGGADSGVEPRLDETGEPIVTKEICS